MNQQTVQSSRSEKKEDFFQRKQLLNTKSLQKFFDSAEKYFRVQGKLTLKQFPDITQQMHATFLLGKSFYQAKDV